MLKHVTIAGESVKLKRTKWGSAVVWASDPIETLKCLKNVAINERKAIKAAFNKSLAKKKRNGVHGNH